MLNKQPTTKSTPSTAATVMQEMMDTIDAMRRFYVRETEVLAKADTKGFYSLQDEKMATARRYQDSMEKAMGRKDELLAADPQLKSRLEAIHKDFQETAEKNLGALKRMSRCIDHIGNTMRHAAKEEASKQRSFSYGQTGTLRHSENKSVSMGISETA